MENQNFLTNTPVKVQIEDELAKRRKQAKSRVKMSKTHSKGNIYLSKENGVCVFIVLTSEHNETLDAEKHGSSVSPAASERMSCAAVLILYSC